MNKEEILQRSRNEMKNVDLTEKEAQLHAWNNAGRIGAMMCCIVSVINVIVTGEMIYVPWIIYFSILGTKSIVTYLKLRQKSDMIISIIYICVAILFFALYIMKLNFWGLNA